MLVCYYPYLDESMAMDNLSSRTGDCGRWPQEKKMNQEKEMMMRNVILITVVGFFLAIGTAYGKPINKNPEVAELQKLEQIVSKQVEVGVSSKNQLLKVRILEIRSLYINGELTQDEWLAKEQKLNAELLKLQLSEVSHQGDKTIDQVFEFQNTLLSTRELFKRNAGANKSEQDKR